MYRSGFPRLSVGIFDLTKNLGFAEHHALEAGRDSEDVTCRVLVPARERMGTHVPRPDASELSECIHQVLAVAPVLLHRVDLHTIARGQQHHLFEPSLTHQPVEVLDELIPGDGELLTQLDKNFPKR